MLIELLLTKGNKISRYLDGIMRTAPSLTESVFEASQAGKHKIPRFIYHMTSKKNYESIMAEGVIKVSKDGLIGKGVFTAELSNFFKRWRKDKSWGESRSLQEKLLRQVAKRGDEVVILRIPTANLDQNKLVVRSQNKLFSWTESEKCDEIYEMVFEKISKDKKEKRYWFDYVRGILIDVVSRQKDSELAKHLLYGTPAKWSKLLKQRKQALEYIYKDNIPISQVEKIGEVNIKELRESAEYDTLRPMRSIFTHLLKGTPEVKGAELLTC